MSASAGLYCNVSSCLRKKVSVRGAWGEKNLQADETRLKALLEEDSLLLLGPFDVVGEDLDLRLLRVRDCVQEVE